MENNNSAAVGPATKKMVTMSAETAKVFFQDTAKEVFVVSIGGEKTWVDTARFLLRWVAVGFCVAHKPSYIGTVTAFVFPLQYAAFLAGNAIYNNWFVAYVKH